MKSLVPFLHCANKKVGGTKIKMLLNGEVEVMRVFGVTLVDGHGHLSSSFIPVAEKSEAPQASTDLQLRSRSSSGLQTTLDTKPQGPLEKYTLPIFGMDE